jgi:hypothetical protein
MNFKGQSASGAKDTCDFATEDVPFDSLPFSITEMESV